MRKAAYLSFVSRPLAFSAESLAGYFAMSSSKVLRAAALSPRLLSAVPMISRASGAFALSG
jgi:hypothetical protein